LKARDCFRFPVATPEARRDLLVGGLLMFTLLPGWILNLGHRLGTVQRLFHGESPSFRGFAPWGHTFVRGLTAWLAIAVYLSPAALLGAGAWLRGSVALAIAAGVAFALGVFSLPGGMTYNAAYGDIRYLYRPDRAFRRAVAGGRAYLHAWAIAAAAIALSLLGLLAGGVGFFWTSVWAWNVVGYAFSSALALRPRP
jgi:hypothetical protein